MRIINCLTLVFIFIFSVLNLSAQDKIVHGTVTVFDSILVNQASVKVKSTKQVVYTDSLGNFSAPVADKDILVVNAKGFNVKRVRLNEKTKFAAINLQLKPNDRYAEYAIGYGHITDKEKFNELYLLQKESGKDYSKYASVLDIIQGEFAGVMIVNGEVWVHGPSSLHGDQYNAATIILDGNIVDMDAVKSLPTTRIKSVKLVKDGTAAIYGTRGGTGVIIIETKYD